MKPEIITIIGLFFAFAIIEALRGSFLTKAGQRDKDVYIEIIGAFVLLFATQPLIILTVNWAMTEVLPAYENALAGLPVVAAIGLFLVFDDMLQYWLHRTVHNVPWMYDLHRAHHDAEYMSVRIVYRNGLFYYAIMPGIWFSAILVWLGLGWTYAGYIVVKMAVICGAHSDVRWDEKLYKIKLLAPLMWVLERTISTPATHHAHHGRHADDPATHYKGNYGNLLFLWDIIFGTAKITRRYPAAYGVEKLQDVGAAQQLLWPLVQRDGSSVMQK